MGKNLRQQRRGRGGSVYRSPSHKHAGPVKYPPIENGTGKIMDFIHAPGRNCPLARVMIGNEIIQMISAEGMQVGQEISIGDRAPIITGNITHLANIPEGTMVYNIEGKPGDGGKFVRTPGTYAMVVSRGKKVVLQMPSGEFKTFDARCRASIGIVAGGGHKEKPFGKAGAKFHAYRSKAKAYFKVRGVAMNAVDHPHGGGSHQHIGKPSTVSRNAPPGRKVGHLAPKKKRRK